jgi:hypothetical protein
MRITFSLNSMQLLTKQKAIARKERNLIVGFLRVNDLKHKFSIFYHNCTKLGDFG